MRNHLYIFIQTLKYSRKILVHQIKSDAKKPPEIHANQINLLMDVAILFKYGKRWSEAESFNNSKQD